MTNLSVRAKAPNESVSRASFVVVDLVERPIRNLRPVGKPQLAKEDEINQLPQAEIVPLLLTIAKTMRAYHGIKLATLGFHNGQDEMLMIVPVEGMPVSELADALMIRPSTVSKMADRLLEKGLLQRVSDPRDARRTIVKLTSAGMEARNDVSALHSHMEAELARMMDRDSADVHRACLKECLDILKARLSRLR